MEQMIVRLSSELKAKASALANSEGTDISKLVRKLLENYVQERDLSAHMAAIWQGLGNTLKKSGMKLADVDEEIQAMRKEKRARRH